MSDHGKAGVLSGLREAAPASAPHRDSELAALAGSTDARKLGYGALAFWIVVAVLVAARIAFLEPGTIKATSALPGTKVSASTNAS